MRVGVLGGTRFIGVHVVEALLEAGAEVWLFHRGRTTEPALFSAPVARVLGDRAAAANLELFFRRDYDAVIDLSGYCPAHVRPIMERWRSMIGHYLFCSTSSVYLPAAVLSYEEDSPLLRDPGTYGGDKALAEEALIGYGARHGWAVTVLRAHAVLGRLGAEQPLYLARRILAGVPILLRPGTAERLLNPLWVEDLARCFVRLIGRQDAFGRAFNVAGDEPCTPHGLAVLIRDALGEGRIHEVALDPAVAEALPWLGLPWLPRDVVVNNGKIRGLLDMSFMPLAGIVGSVLNWARESPGGLRLQRQRWEGAALRGAGAPPAWVLWSWRYLDGLRERLRDSPAALRLVRAIRRVF